MSSEVEPKELFVANAENSNFSGGCLMYIVEQSESESEQLLAEIGPTKETELKFLQAGFASSSNYQLTH
jgi:hypothetical protein